MSHLWLEPLQFFERGAIFDDRVAAGIDGLSERLRGGIPHAARELPLSDVEVRFALLCRAQCRRLNGFRRAPALEQLDDRVGSIRRSEPQRGARKLGRILFDPRARA